MLTLILGTDWVTNRDHILQRVGADVRSCKKNRILLVPELISHDMERRLCVAGGDTASRFAQVLSFTRLARRVAESERIPLGECMDNGGRVIAMAAAARQLHSRLKAYASVETRPEFLAGLVETVDECKRCCVTAADLKRASGETQGSFAQKLEELSLLLETYDAICAQGKRDPRDQMTWLLECMADSDFAAKHTFYIDGFPDFTRQHMAILEHLILNAPEVTISLNCDKPGSSAAAFETAGDTALSLIRFAQRAGISFAVETLEPRPVPMQPVHQKLFSGSIAPMDALRGRVILHSADSVYTACTMAAERILTLVHEGCRYRDIGVVCTDMAAYQNVISLVFHRSGIPLYRSGTEDVLQKTAVTTVLSAMDAALGGFEQQDVLRYLKSVLSPLKMDEADRVENYAILWGINGSRWQTPWENHPDGLGEEWTDEARKRLADLNRSRKLAMDPLVQLCSDFGAAQTLSDQVRGIYAFFDRIGLAKHLQTLAEALDDAGDNRTAQILNQLWEILLSALEQMYDVLGNTTWETQTFTRLFTLLLAQYDVGTIPPVLDSVMVGPVSAMRCQEVEHLIVLGASEGMLPGYCASSGVLTDQERRQLRMLGVALNGGSAEGLQAEFSEIYGVFCGARQSITVSCDSGQPSFLYHRLSALTPDGPVTDTIPGASIVDVHDAAALLKHYEAAEAAEHLGLTEHYREICTRSSYTLGAITQENIEKLYGKKLRLSASQVDRQAECRFSYFLKYGMRARERKEASVDPAEFGTYVHAVLEHTAKKVMDLGGFHKVSLDVTMGIALEYSEEYAAERFGQLESQRFAYLFRRNFRELEMVVRELWQELSVSLFTPVDFEVAFGDGQQMPAISIPNASIEAQVRGFVDRVDAWQKGDTNYFRVVDYKTGRKDFDYCDIFNGLGLQMLLYLFALEDGGASLLGDHRTIAGVQYFPARSPLISVGGRLSDAEADAERGKVWKRKGLVLSEPAVLEAMEPEDAPKRLSCKVNKDGDILGDVADISHLHMLKKYVFTLLANMVEQILSGHVDPDPYTRGSAHNACAYCPYKPVCHYQSVPGRRNYRAMSAERFWEEVAREVGTDG